MKVELSFHDTTTRQVLRNVETVIYNGNVAVVHLTKGDKYVYPLVSLHRIKEMPSGNE